jgi:hypothetical protein
MMGTETVPETLDFNELTRLSAREDFMNFMVPDHRSVCDDGYVGEIRVG